MRGATEATAWNWKPIEVRVTKMSASATHRLLMAGHDSGRAGPRPRAPCYPKPCPPSPPARRDSAARPWRLSDDHTAALRHAGRSGRVDHPQPLRLAHALGVRGRPRLVAEPLREGQGAAVERQHADRLVARPRSREPPGAARRADLDLRLRHLEPAHPQGAGRPAPPPAGPAALAVHARRAGRAAVRLEDRPAGPQRRRQVLRGYPGDG